MVQSERDGGMKKTIGDELVFKDVNPCSKCGSAKTNFWYCIIPPTPYSVDGRIMAFYECCGRNHKHSILEPDLRAYGKNLRIAMSRAKKLWNQNNQKIKKKKVVEVER